MMFFRREMAMLEHTSTNVVASPMPMPLDAMVVTARVGHIPRRVTRVGFSRISPLVNS